MSEEVRLGTESTEPHVVESGQSGEFRPSEYQSSEYQPSEYQPSEYQPSEYQPSEYQPIEEYRPSEWESAFLSIALFGGLILFGVGCVLFGWT